MGVLVRFSNGSQVCACVRACVRVCVCESNQSIFYFMSVHIEVILDKNKKQKHNYYLY